MTTIHLPYGTSPALEKQLDVQILDLRVNVGQGFNHAILDKRDCICVIRALYVTGRGASATFCKTSLKDLLRFRLLLSNRVYPEGCYAITMRSVAWQHRDGVGDWN